MNRIFVTMFSLIVVFGLQAYPVKITSWQIQDDVKKLNQLHASVDYVNPETQTIIAYVSNDSGFSELLANGLRAERIPDLAKEYADSLWNATKDTRDPLRAYLTLTEYSTFMQNTAAQYPDICQLIQFGTSVQGNPLYFMKISDNVSMQENEPEFRFLSSMHGDEVVGYDMCIRMIQLLTSQYGTNTRISNLVNNMEIWICPLFNPDGYLAHDRYNYNGVDLNRNYPLPVGSPHPDGMAWAPENIALMNHSNAQSINFSVNFHGGSLVTNYPWDYTYALCPDNDLFIQASLAYADYNLPMHNSAEFANGITNGAAWYIVLGSLQDWVYANNSDMDLTIELSYDKWPAASTLDTYWSQNQESMLSLMEYSQRGVRGIVTNADGEPIAATIHINSSGVNVYTDPDVGDYHRILLPGNYTITVSATGYQTAAANLSVTSGSATLQDFVLQPVVTTNFSGTVTAQSGTVISGANLILDDTNTTYTGQTDSQGAFSLSGIPSGLYQLIVSKQGYGNFNTSFSLSAESNKQIIVLPNPLFADYFENGLSNWTVQAPWSIVNQSSNNVLTDSPSGSYSNNANLTAALTNPVSLNNVSNPSLSYDLKYNLEASYDFLYVYGSTDGSTWNTLASYTGVQTDWQTINISLNLYQNHNFYLKFRLSSDNGVTADGVYIDNVIISGLPQGQTVYGDIDANWMINMQDVYTALDYTVDSNLIPEIDPFPWEPFRLLAADVDNDSQITSTDCYYIYDRILNYSPFPVQNGTAIGFQNTGLELSAQNDTLYCYALDPSDLKCMSMTFTAVSGFEFFALTNVTNDSRVRVAINLAARKLSFLVLNSQNLNSVGASIFYTNPGNVIHCEGLVNNYPVSQDITSSPNQDVIQPSIITSLLGNYPNPVKIATTICYSLAKDTPSIKINIYNTKGQLARSLVAGNLAKGNHTFDFDVEDNNHKPLSNGVYYYQLVTPETTKTAKMIILR